MKLTPREIAIAGVMSAIAVLLAATPLGFIPFIAGTSITIMHIPVIIGAVVGGPIVGTIIALIFGLSSLILAAVAPRGPGDVFFTDPLVSVLPRLFIGVAAWGVYRLVRAAGQIWAVLISGLILVALVLAVAYLVSTSGLPGAAVLGLVVGVVGLVLVAGAVYRAYRAHPEALALSLAAVAGTLTNTVLVLGMLVLRGYIPTELALAVGAANSPPEMIAAAFITVAVVATWQQITLRAGGSSI